MIFVAENYEENELVQKLAREYGGSHFFREDSFAISRWSIDDVLSVQPHLTREAAESFLEEYESNLRSSAVSGGWDFLDYADYSAFKSVGQERTVDELIRDNISRDEMSKVEEKTFVEYWYDKYEETGFVERFTTPYKNDKQFEGKSFKVLGRCEVEELMGLNISEAACKLRSDFYILEGQSVNHNGGKYVFVKPPNRKIRLTTDKKNIVTAVHGGLQLTLDSVILESGKEGRSRSTPDNRNINSGFEKDR